MKLTSFRSLLYKSARAIGDMRAVSKGTDATVRRVERRALGRLASKAIAKMMGKR